MLVSLLQNDLLCAFVWGHSIVYDLLPTYFWRYSVLHKFCSSFLQKEISFFLFLNGGAHSTDCKFGNIASILLSSLLFLYVSVQFCVCLSPLSSLGVSRLACFGMSAPHPPLYFLLVFWCDWK